MLFWVKLAKSALLIVIWVATVVDDPEVKPSGTAALPASPTDAVMLLADPALAEPVVKINPGSVLAPPVVQVLLGTDVKPNGAIPAVRHHW